MTAAAVLTLAACGDDEPSTSDGGTTVEVNTNKNVATSGIPSEVTRLEFPKLKGGASKVIVYHSTHSCNPDGVNFSVEWDCDKKSQRWTCYTLTKTNKQSNTGRWYGDTRADQTSMTAQYFFDTTNLNLDDFYYRSYNVNSVRDYIYSSGFDHGHICPSADRTYSVEANKQTFYLTNMQPQYAVFNGSDKSHQYKGLWINMENFVHKYSLQDNDTMYVCKGGTIDNEDQILQRIEGKLIVPKYFFAAVLLKRGTNYKAIGFWFEHSSVYHGDDELGDYIVNIDELERKTGIDFFCNLPDATENSVESNSVANIKRAWGFN